VITDPIDPEVRDELGRAWATDALDEHASIATFARFSLQLLALAAPPELITRAHEAALDEIRHARGSFAIASWFGGVPVGPGALAIDEPARALDPIALVEETVRDGCIGETAATVIATVERDACEVPAIRELRDTIAHDEARHASLAWRFVAWSIATYGEPARAALVRVMTAAPDAGGPPHTSASGRYGRLDDANRRWITARVHAAIASRVDDFLADPDAAISTLAGAWR
jgi:hypothetical protein